MPDRASGDRAPQKAGARDDASVMSKSYQWDAFISYASEDRATVARPLAEKLTRMGGRVWFDQTELKLGDSLSRTIDRGLARSAFGVVVLSKAFFTKRWTEYELRGLVAKDIDAPGGRILPVWHQITREDLVAASPPLADTKAVSTADGIPLIASKILSVIRPDLFDALHRRVVFGAKSKLGTVANVRFDELQLGPLLHKEIPDHLIARIRLVRAALLSVNPHSMRYWIDSFRSDAQPTTEIRVWEHIATYYLEIIQTQKIPRNLHEHVFVVLLRISMGEKLETILKDNTKLPKSVLFAIFETAASKMPIVDFQDRWEPRKKKRIASPKRIEVELLDDESSKIAPDVVNELIDFVVKNVKGSTRDRKRRRENGAFERSS